MFSILNPEAPEFFPHFIEATQDGFKAISKSIQISNLLPSGNSRDTFKTFTDFNIITCKLSDNVILQSNIILTGEKLPSLMDSNDDERNVDKIVDANDTMLDRANTNIDIALGLTKPAQAGVVGSPHQAPGANVSAWNVSPVITKIQMGSATLIGAKNVPRPQVHFKDKIDNSESLWVPKISDKPNSIKPLALTILYDDNGEAVGYEHPYNVELDLYAPGARLVEGDEGEPSPPAPLDATPLTLVETEPQLEALLEHLRGVSELSVDLEHHSYRTYQGITCLIQLSTDEGGDFIIDALALREHLHRLNQPFTDPNKLKVFHGADQDVVWLQRDFGVYVVGLFDTHQAARALQLSGLSLRHLLYVYCQVDADKKYQLADWRMRPLPAELVQYARVDTHYLLYIWRRMRWELRARGERAGGDPHALLRAVFNASRDVCARTYKKETCGVEAHLALYTRSRKHFTSRQLAALKLLYKWRDQQARDLDESTAYLLPNHMLLALSETMPREMQGVLACCSPTPPFVKQNLIILHQMILSCRELPQEPALYRMPAGIRAALSHQVSASSYKATFHDLLHRPDYREDLTVALTSKSSLTSWSVGDAIRITPEVHMFRREVKTPTGKTFVSDLNAEAKSFIPPFTRYRRYRTLAQIEELRVFMEKEAKIAAISKGDALIQNEVLSKVKQEILQKQEDTDHPTADTTQRKRKKPSTVTPTGSAHEHALKPNFNYRNVNYKKFSDESDKKQKLTHQSKPKFKILRRGSE